jgi:hypothetical protein
MGYINGDTSIPIPGKVEIPFGSGHTKPGLFIPDNKADLIKFAQDNNFITFVQTSTTFSSTKLLTVIANKPKNQNEFSIPFITDPLTSMQTGTRLFSFVVY